MSTPPPPAASSLPHPTPRPPEAQVFMALPLLFGALLMVSVLTLGVLVYRGFSPQGERLSMRLEGACAAEARPVIEARIATVGLGAPEVVLEGERVLRVTATLPGQDPDQERTAIPRLLSRRGWFGVRAKGKGKGEGEGEGELVSGEAVVGATLQLDESGVAMAVVTLEEAVARALSAHVLADPGGALTLWLDGELLAERPNTARIVGTELRILGSEGAPRARMAAAAAQVVVLQSGPLPCDLAVAEVVRVEDVQ